MSLLEDATSGALPVPSNPGGIDDVLAQRGVHVVTMQGWRAIDRAERALGATRGRDRTTIQATAELLEASRG